MQEPAKSLADLLFANWSISNPAKDTVAESPITSGDKVWFGTRYWAAPPQVIRQHQISILAGQESTEPLNMGSITKYQVNAQLLVHVWALAGTGDSFDSEQTRLRNMIDEVHRIIKSYATTATDIQYLIASPGSISQDELMLDSLRFHRVIRVTAIFYRV